MSLSKIEWTDYTWNPWWGCSKIAAECLKCYPIPFAARNLHPCHTGVVARDPKTGLFDWSGKITRSLDRVWMAPFRWPPGSRVFTCSMSDFFHPNVPMAWFAEGVEVIERTPHLVYQVLTKRPGMVARRLAAIGRTRLPANVQLGVTIGHVDSLPLLKPLRKIEARLRFLSCEPLLTSLVPGLDLDGIDWLIAGGESGVGARSTAPNWVRELRDLCLARTVPFFFKQWGHVENNPTPWCDELDKDAKGGATLDGRLWRQFPRADAAGGAPGNNGLEIA